MLGYSMLQSELGLLDLKSRQFFDHLLHNAGGQNEVFLALHVLRIIFSHIGYLDSFRCYLLKNIVKPSIEIENMSMLILKTIRKYCTLITGKEKVAKCAATKRFGQIVSNLEEAENNPCDPTKTINRKVVNPI